LQDFLSVFSFRNVTNDGELSAICEQLNGVMKGITVEQLRESEGLKEKVGAKIAAAVASLQVMTAGIRKFQKEED
jgi:hypothetical protein